MSAVMIHAKTTAVGCAEAKCVTKATAACFYDQPELQNGELIYTKGKPCVANDQCKTYQPSTCANGFCVKGDPPTTPAESSSSETTPSSTSSESTTPSSTASESTSSNSTSPESSTPSSTSSESTTPSITSSESTTPIILSSESTTPSITSSESGATPNSTASESTTLGETSPTINQICPSNWGVNDKIRNKTLDAHNYRRSQLALGQIRKRNGNYYQRARDMIKLKYSCQLEVSARDHAVTCRNRPSSPSTRPNIEENVARIPKNSVPDRVEAIRKAITLWWKTGRKEKPIGVALTFRRHHLNSPIRHFTKMAWAQTREIGCAVRDCGSSYIAVCHYKPGGNIINHKIYEAGRPCSRCPANARCSEGLCVI
ncbi:SCP-like protein [Ancylostoma duodenale]|uniref:SCP-like protein n=1 Tax=Ancylostoma duodenale TaxID=51022 RepID=A0A0C2CEC8_9BILA|nr:SCP-like protein [Ancylostoma duodenale]